MKDDLAYERNYIAREARILHRKTGNSWKKCLESAKNCLAFETENGMHPLIGLANYFAKENAEIALKKHDKYY